MYTQICWRERRIPILRSGNWLGVSTYPNCILSFHPSLVFFILNHFRHRLVLATWLFQGAWPDVAYGRPSRNLLSSSSAEVSWWTALDVRLAPEDLHGRQRPQSWLKAELLFTSLWGRVGFTILSGLVMSAPISMVSMVSIVIGTTCMSSITSISVISWSCQNWVLGLAAPWFMVNHASNDRNHINLDNPVCLLEKLMTSLH